MPFFSLRNAGLLLCVLVAVRLVVPLLAHGAATFAPGAQVNTPDGAGEVVYSGSKRIVVALDASRSVAGYTAGELSPVATATPTPTPTASPTPTAGTTYYVSPSGSDANPGTQASPFKTVQHAFSQLGPGDTLVLRGGTYREDLVYDRVGTADDPITVRAYDGETPILEPVTREPLRVKGSAAYTTFRGLTIQHAARGSNYQNVYVLGDANHITFRQNVIRWALEGSGVFIDDTTDHIGMVGNDVYQNNGANQHQGIYDEGADSLIAGNVVWGHTNGFGIQVKSGADRVTVAENTTADNSHSGIVVMDTATNVDVVNNISAYNGDYGIRGYDDSPGGSSGTNRAWGNLLYGNSAGACANQYAGIIDCGTERPSQAPGFVDRSAHNYRLAAGSPAIDVAVSGYVFSPGADGETRPIGPAGDLGAYEAG